MVLSEKPRKGAVVAAVGTAVAVVAAVAPVGIPAATAGPPTPSGTGSVLGPNVYIFTPSTPQAQIQSTVDAIAAQQVPNQFGAQRYALLFEPGTYGTPADPLNFQVGYYTEVAGLGQSPSDVVINGSIDVRNQCDSGGCVALNNFWRSMSNLTIDVNTPNAGCYAGEFWAVSQAAPMRRVAVTGGNTTLMDYCTGPSFASGGYIADSSFSGGTVINGSQQQFFVRNSRLDGWTNGVWNQVFVGDNGAPAQCFPAASGCGNPYTTVATTPVSQEEPYLYTDAAGGLAVFVPALAHDTSGPSWTAPGGTAGTSVPLSDFFVADPSTPVTRINAALASGQDLLLTPGVYNLDRTIQVRRPGTVVLGLGFPTLVPTNGNVAMATASVPGVKLSGIIFDAGATNSPALLQVGSGHGPADRPVAVGDPTLVQDVFFRIGGAEAGRATDALVVDQPSTILDDVWAWRADHGAGVGWTANTSDTGLVVNADDVTAYGLAVEHFQKNEVVWNGQGGSDYFFQNEMPYDVPNQQAWMSDPYTNGYPAFLVGPAVQSFQGYGMGSYSFFNQGQDIHSATAFSVPTRAGVAMHDLLTVWLNGSGAIDSVIDGTGGSVSAANPDTPATVTTYP